MATYEDTNPRRLKDLLNEIDQKASVLPDFQRDFVWEPGMVAGLIASVASLYPAGSLLRVRNTKQFFAWRIFQGAPEPPGLPTFLILDGQQRLTSLYQALFGVGDYRFFIRLATLLKGDDIEEAVFYERTNSKKHKALESVEAQAQQLILPLALLRGEYARINQWINSVAELTSGDSMKVFRGTQEKLQILAERWLKPIEDYQFPVVTLSDETSADALCTIFETLNRTGIKLTVFELLTARFYPQKINLRHLWDDAVKQHPTIKEFGVDPYQILQAITLRATDSAPTCKKGRLLELTHADLTAHWSPVVAALAAGLEILQEDCGVVNGSWLPYSPMLVPMMAVLAKHPPGASADAGARRAKLIRWFWCSSLSSRYEAAANTRAEEDYTALSLWFTGEGAPETVDRFSFDESRLQDVTPRQRALYRALMCLALRSAPNGTKERARDFNSGRVITAALMRDANIEDHHIFPRGFLPTKPAAENVHVDCILNRTLIDGPTNRRISARPPSQYLGEVRNALTQAGSGVELVLRSHMIAGHGTAAVWTDDFPGFLKERRHAFSSAITSATATHQPSLGCLMMGSDIYPDRPQAKTQS